MNDLKAKTDCFGYCKKGDEEKCKALNKLFCKQENCKFYKTQKIFDLDQEKWGYVIEK